LIPGGVNNGVTNAIIVSTSLVERQFMTKTCKKAIISNNNTPHKETKSGREPSTETEKIGKEGTGEVKQTAPTPEQQMKRHR